MSGAALLFIWCWLFSDNIRRWVVNTALAIDDARRIGRHTKNWKPPEDTTP